MKIFNLIITTKRNLEHLLCKSHLKGTKYATYIDNRITWAAINPVIHSLKELRKNTWDVERVDKAIKWLTDNFKVKE